MQTEPPARVTLQPVHVRTVVSAEALAQHIVLAQRPFAWRAGLEQPRCMQPLSEASRTHPPPSRPHCTRCPRCPRRPRRPRCCAPRNWRGLSALPEVYPAPSRPVNGIRAWTLDLDTGDGCSSPWRPRGAKPALEPRVTLRRRRGLLRWRHGTLTIRGGCERRVRPEAQIVEVREIEAWVARVEVRRSLLPLFPCGPSPPSLTLHSARPARPAWRCGTSMKEHALGTVLARAAGEVRAHLP